MGNVLDNLDNFVISALAKSRCGLDFPSLVMALPERRRTQELTESIIRLDEQGRIERSAKSDFYRLSSLERAQIRAKESLHTDIEKMFRRIERCRTMIDQATSDLEVLEKRYKRLNG